MQEWISVATTVIAFVAVVVGFIPYTTREIL